MSDDNRAVNTALTEEEDAAFAFALSRWTWGKAPVALFLSIILTLWRNAWEKSQESGVEVNEPAYAFHGTDRSVTLDTFAYNRVVDAIPLLSKHEREALKKVPVSRRLVAEVRGSEILLRGGTEYVNERFKALIAKCVPSPITRRKPDQAYDEKGRPILQRQLPLIREGEPLVDTKGRLVIAIRTSDRKGNASPQPKTHPAWILLHTGEGFWVSEKWLRLHGLIYEKSWWGEVYDEQSGANRPRPKTWREILYHPCLMTQAELNELRAIMLISTIAEEHGMVKSAALTVRKDGSIETGVQGFGPKSTDARDLYQELHDKDSDDTRTMAKAMLEQKRTNTLPWMIADYDGPTSRRRDLDMFSLGLHPGYHGVKPLPKPDLIRNTEMDSLGYRIGSDALLAHEREDGAIMLLREKNVLDLPGEVGKTFIPRDNPTRLRCVRKLEEYVRKNGSVGKYIRYGESVPARYVTEYYSTGLPKRIDRSIREELDGMIRGLIEAGQFTFTLHRRADEHAGSRVHRCHRASCPRDEHAFNDKGYAHVCGASGQEYWMVKAMLVLDLKYFPFLEFAQDVDKLVVDVYGPFVGELMQFAPEGFVQRVPAGKVMDRPMHMSPEPTVGFGGTPYESVIVPTGADPRTQAIMELQARQDARGKLNALKARLREGLVRRGWMRRPCNRLGVVKPTYTAADYKVD